MPTDVDAYGNPEIPTTGTTIVSPWGEAVQQRIVATYPTSAERDTLEVAPETGHLCYLTSTGVLQLFDGSAWRNIGLAEAPEVLVRAWDDASVPMVGTIGDGPSYDVVSSYALGFGAGWQTAHVAAVVTVAAGSLPDGGQLLGYVSIDGDDGTARVSPAAQDTEHPVAHLTVAHEVADVDASGSIDVNLEVYVENATVTGAETIRYVSGLIVAVRTA